MARQRVTTSEAQLRDEAGLDPVDAFVETIDRPNAYRGQPYGLESGVLDELYPERGDVEGAFSRALSGRARKPMPVMDDPPSGVNLAETLPLSTLNELGRDLIEEITSAEQSRQEWEDLAVKGIKALGFDRKSESRSVPYKNASNVVHPAFSKALVAMAARISAQLSPPEGPVRTIVVGKSTKEAEDRAARVARFMNWQCTEQMVEWQPETDRLLMMVGCEGSSFKKLWYDPVEKRPRSAYVPSQNIIMPYDATCEMTSPLVAEAMWLMRHQVEANIASGWWLEHDVGEPTYEAVSEIRKATEQVVGLSDSGSSAIPRYRGLKYFECMVTRAISGLSDEPREYVVTISREREQVVAIRRNWKTGDPLRRRRRLLQHYKLFPWAGVYGVGLFHMIGGLGVAATGALRALLDSAHISNMGGGFRAKSARQSGGAIERKPGVFVDVELPPGMQRIQDVLMADTTTQPSPVLFEMLGAVSVEADQFAGVALQDVANATSTTPVGTQMARVDEGSRVFSGIFSRLHKVQGRELQELYAIDAETLAEQAQFYVFEDAEVGPQDFQGPISVVPVSDPRAYSQMQRVLMGEGRLQLARAAMADGVQGVDIKAAYVAAAQSMQMPDVDVLFPPDQDPLTVDPFTENAALVSGRKLAAQPQQPHEEHLMVHLALLKLPGMIVTPAGQQLMQHMVQHAGMGALALAIAGQTDAGAWYADWMAQIAPAMLPPGDPSVDKLVKVEEAKVDATREKTEIETDAKLKISDQETENQLREMALAHQQKMAQIAAESDKAAGKVVADMTLGREKIASEERKKAADIMAKAAAPPPKPSKS